MGCVVPMLVVVLGVLWLCRGRPNRIWVRLVKDDARTRRGRARSGTRRIGGSNGRVLVLLVLVLVLLVLVLVLLWIVSRRVVVRMVISALLLGHCRGWAGMSVDRTRETLV